NSGQAELTDEGKKVAATVDALYERHTQSLEQIGQIDPNSFEQLNKSLQRLERFWTDQILYRL
ncbi:MAG: MarR family transcriptional regulator, partial [Pseudomonadota bacterium]